MFEQMIKTSIQEAQCASSLKNFTDSLLRLKGRGELCNMCMMEAASVCFDDDVALGKLLLLAGERWEQIERG